MTLKPIPYPVLLLLASLLYGEETNACITNFNNTTHKGEALKGVEYHTENMFLYKKNNEVTFKIKDSIKTYPYRKGTPPQVDSIVIEEQIAIPNHFLEKDTIRVHTSIQEPLNVKTANKSAITNTLILFLVTIIIVIPSSVFCFIRIRRKYKNIMTTSIEKDTSISVKKEEVLEKVISDLPVDFVKEIIIKLDAFEKSNKFVKSKYTLYSLAKEMNTNSAYLSRIINEAKKVNFSNYLNNLRIDYAIEHLKEDKQLRSYTIKAIAKEVGFNNAQSFSIAFYKRIGMHPSCFLKQLQTTDGLVDFSAKQLN